MLLPLALVGTALFAQSLADQAFHGFFAYETPFTFTGGAVPRTAPLSPRVVMVLVDGLGLGPSRELPFLNELRAQGADYAVRVGLPSLSQPARAVLMTGAWQEVHGQTTNYKPRPLKVEHLFQSARGAGLRTAVAAGDGTLKLFRPHVGQELVFADVPETAPFEKYVEIEKGTSAKIQELLKGDVPEFTYLESHIVDECGHGWGAASEEYKKATQIVDEDLRRFFSAVDLTQATFIVTADHGHVPEGGHGGPEEPVMSTPLVMVGRGVKVGAKGEARQADVASTLATLLGIPIPAGNQGRPLLDALEIDPAGRLAVLRSLVVQREGFVARYVKTVRALDEEPVPGLADVTPEAAQTTESALQAQLTALDHTAETARDQRVAFESQIRSRRALLVAALPLVVLGVLLVTGAVRGRELPLALLAAGLAVAAYYLLLPVFGLRYSITAVNKDEWLPAFFRKNMILAVATCAAAVLLACLRRARAGEVQEAVLRASYLVPFGFAYAFVVKMAVIYWRQGVVLRWHIPDLYWGFGFYLDLVAVMAVGFAALVLPALAFLALRLAPPPAPAAEATLPAAS